jgi:hypothetical protein
MAIPWLSGVFGSKPTVPNLPHLNLSTEQGKAIASNQANLPAAEQLTSAANAFSQQQIQAMLAQAIPGYQNLVQGVTGDISSMVSGQLPADVRAQIQQSTAASAVAGGYGGSGMAGNLTARDLGLTSLNLTQQGISSAQSWMQQMNNMFGPSMLNVSSMFVSPQQQAAFDVEERNAQFQRQWMESQISAMPDPMLRGLHDTIMQLATAYLSKGGGSSYKSMDTTAAYGEAGADFSGGGFAY